MAISHGMNVQEVRTLGQKLQSVAGELNTIIGQLNAQVNSTTWVGPDATMFKTQWWPEHQQQLKVTAEGLSGFGQSALNNASAQEDASRPG